MKKRGQHKRHHYVSQFILKNFSKDQNGIKFYDKNIDNTYTEKIRDKFQEHYLYRDERLKNPNKIEVSIGVIFEDNVARLVRNKIIVKK